MPLSALAQVILEVFGEAVVRGAWHAGETAVDEVQKKRERQRRRKRAQLRALADLLVIAASHDHVVTEAERQELTNKLPRLLDTAGADLGPDALVERWSEELRSV